MTTIIKANDDLDEQLFIQFDTVVYLCSVEVDSTVT